MRLRSVADENVLGAIRPLSAEGGAEALQLLKSLQVRQRLCGFRSSSQKTFQSKLVMYSSRSLTDLLACLPSLISADLTSS